MKNARRAEGGRQVTLFNSMAEQFKSEAYDAALKSADAARRIILEKDVDGKELAHALAIKLYDKAMGMAESSGVQYRHDGMVKPEEMVKLVHISYGSDLIVSQLAEYDLIFDELVLEDKETFEVKDRLLFEENRKFIDYLEKEASKAGKLSNGLMNGSPKPSKYPNSKSNTVNMRLSLNLFSLMMSSRNHDGIWPHTKRKLLDIEQIMIDNGFPGYRDLVVEKLDAKKYNDHRAKLGGMFNGHADESLRVDSKSGKTHSTFAISDYSQHDPMEEARKVKDYTDHARFWQNVLEETDYRIDATTKKVVDKLEQTVLTVPSLMTEITRYGNRTDAFKYLQDIFSNEKAKSAVRDYMGTSNEAAVAEIIFDLIGFYDAAVPHRTKVAAKVKEYAEKVQTAERYLSRMRILDEMEKKRAQDSKAKTEYDGSVELAKLPITMFMN